MTWMQSSELNELLEKEDKRKKHPVDKPTGSDLFYMKRQVNKALKNAFKEPADTRHKEPLPSIDHGAGYNSAMYDIHKAMTRPAGRTVKGVSSRRKYSYLYPR